MTQQEFSAPRFGTPPAQSAIARFIGVARGFALNSVALGALVFGAEKLLAPEYKPSNLMGSFVGKVENAETITKQQIAAEYARQMAEAQATAQANAQMEIEINRQQQQKIADSLATQSGIANLTDFACIVGQFIPRDANGDWQTVGTAMRSGCGASAKVREGMVQEQARAGRQGGSIQSREVTTPLPRAPSGERYLLSAPAAPAKTPAPAPRFRPYGDE
jgi:hypothetical protein